MKYFFQVTAFVRLIWVRLISLILMLAMLAWWAAPSLLIKDYKLWSSSKRASQPEELAQLYINSYLHGDLVSLSQVSRAPTDKEQLAKLQSKINSRAERAALQSAADNLNDFTYTAITKTPKLSDDLQYQLIPFAQEQAKAILKTECRVTSSKVLDACWEGESQRMEVYLTCLVPEIPQWTPTTTAQHSLPSAFFTALSSAWEGPAKKPVLVKMRFNAIDEQYREWELEPSHDARTVISVISANLTPDTGRPTNKSKDLPGAINPKLNPCIYRYETDYNNIHILLDGNFWKHAKPADIDRLWNKFGNHLVVYDDRFDETAFHVALRSKASLPVMQALRKKLTRLPGLASLLSEAIKAKSTTETIKWLISEGAPIDELRNHHMRPLIYAVMEGADAKIIDLLVAAGADTSYYFRNINHPDLDALAAVLLTDHADARRAIAWHLQMPESGSELMQYLLSRLSYGVVYRPKYPDGTSDILPILIERGMNLNETFCDTRITHTAPCEPEQRSNLMDLAVGINNPTLIEFFANKGLKPRLKLNILRLEHYYSQSAESNQ